MKGQGETQDLVVEKIQPQEDPYSWPALPMVRPGAGSVLKPSCLLQTGGLFSFHAPLSLKGNGAEELCLEAAAFGELVYPQVGIGRSSFLSS